MLCGCGIKKGNIIHENNTLTIILDGRIDTNNAVQTEKDIFDAIGNSDTEDIIFDAQKL